MKECACLTCTNHGDVGLRPPTDTVVLGTVTIAERFKVVAGSEEQG